MAALVERHDLAVHDRLAGVDPRRRVEQPREVGLGVVAVAGEQLRLAVAHDRLDAVAVPLELVQPVLVAERLGRQRRLHRLEVAGHRRVAGGRQVDLGRRRGGRGDPDRRGVGLDLVVRAARLDALRVVPRVPARHVVGTLLVDQQPLLALVVLERRAGGRAGPAARSDDREAALHLLARQHELELAVGDGGGRVGRLRLGLPRAPVPHDHVARAVLLGRDHALEVEVLHRVVLDVDRHPPDLRIEGRALRDGPRGEHAVDLQPEVVVQARRAMLLDDEPTTGQHGRRGVGRLAGRGLRRLREVALAAVLLERHPSSMPSPVLASAP